MDPLDGPTLPGALPTVTAVMAAHNYAQFVGRALDSVLGQDYPPELLDVIVIDDGSTDETPEILARYGRAHPDRITVIRQPNSGNRAAANNAFPRVRGELMAMIDADDLWPAEKTIRQVELLTSDETLGLVYCDTQVIDPDDIILRPSYWEWLNITPQRGPGAFAEITGYPGNIALNSTIMFRRGLGHRFFPLPTEGIFQDWWITGHCAMVAGIDYVPGLRTGYRQHGRNATLGATGLHEIRELCKTAEMRRKLLIHGGAARLTDEQLLTAWQAWEHTGREAAWKSQTVYIPIARSTEDERAQGCVHDAAAREAMAARDLSAALREAVTALACDPDDRGYRERVEDLRWVFETTAARFADPRKFVTLAFADELVAAPDLLCHYTEAVRPGDQATLAIFAPGLASEQAVATVRTAAGGAGLEVDELPDVMLVTDDRLEARSELERHANAVLSHRGAGPGLPRFRPESFPALRALAIA